MKSVIITGVSSGLGLETAKIFINNGYFVFGSVRNKADRSRLSELFGKDNFLPLLFDVTDERAIDESVKIVKDNINDKALDCLINNAGIVTFGPLMELKSEEIKTQMEVNFIGQVNVIRAFLPLLKQHSGSAKSKSKIINISSVSGRIAYPFIGAYAASKHALEAFSHSLRRELLPFNIDVIIVGPATIKTPMLEKIRSQDFSERFKTSYYGPAIAKLNTEQNKGDGLYLKVEKIARKIFKIYLKRYPKTRYNFTKNYLRSWLLPHLLPDRWIDFFIKLFLYKK